MSPFAAVPNVARPTGLTYEPFYGLKEKPFSLNADSRFFYQSRSHAPAFHDLLAGIRRRESLNVLSGDIGTGKTTLCRAVLQNLDRKTFSAFVPDPFASREDLLKILLMDFGVASVEDLTSGRLRDASRAELSYHLYDFLGSLAPLQAFAVVFIDEAQNLSNELLEEVRILADADGQLQVVLVGQLELRDKLKLPEMRQVDQRVSVHCDLSPLERDGVEGYIEHRLRKAGGSPDRVNFAPDAVEAIYTVSRGVPRVINRLCDRALHLGYAHRAYTIDREIVDATITEAMPPAPPVRAPAPAAAKAEEPPSTPAVPVVKAGVDPVDIWLSKIEELPKPVDDLDVAAVEAPAAPAAAPRPPAAPQPRVLTEEEKQRRAQMRGHFSAPRHSHAQLTRVERFTRRWTRRFAVAIVGLVAIMAAVIGAPSVFEISDEVVMRWGQEFQAPAMPDAPSAPTLKLAPALALPVLTADDVPAAALAPTWQAPVDTATR